MKGIRRILHIPPTHEDRTWTNKLVLEKTKKEIGKPIVRFSSSWKKAKLALLGHIIRTNTNDPLRQVIFEKDTLHPREIFKRRSGKPRLDWTINTLTLAWDTIMENPYLPFNIDEQEHIDILTNQATERKAPFQTNEEKLKKDNKMFKKGPLA